MGAYCDNFNTWVGLLQLLISKFPLLITLPALIHMIVMKTRIYRKELNISQN